MQLLLWFYVSSCGFKELIKSSLKPLQKAWKSLFNHKSIYHSDGLHVILRCLNFSVHIAPKRHFQTSSTPSIFSIKLIFFRALFYKKMKLNSPLPHLIPKPVLLFSSLFWEMQFLHWLPSRCPLVSVMNYRRTVTLSLVVFQHILKSYVRLFSKWSNYALMAFWNK